MDTTSTTGAMPGTSADTSASSDSTDETGIDASSSSGAPNPPLPPAECGQGFAIPASAQAPGDPVEGRRALLEEGYVTCGIPYALFDLAKPFLGSFADGQALPGRTGNNALVPHNWTVHTTPGGAEIASLNCLECHAGRFNGELMLGLGKADVDYTENIGGALANIPIPDIPIPGLDELATMAQRYQVVGDDTRMLTVGTNPADRLAAVLSAHRDAETLEWTDEPHTAIPDLVLPVDTPPWWHVSKKTGLFFNGMARADHRSTMMYASSLCTDDIAEANRVLEYFGDIRAFLETITPPEYPFAVDATLADEGELLFARDCSCCHGTYDEDPALETYANLLFPLETIGTDPLLADMVVETDLGSWFNTSWYGDVGPLTVAEPFAGYVAPPLDSIWATAPYFHNASVPNIEAVLDSRRRPKWWRREDFDSTHFDEETLGWPHIELPYGQDDAPEQMRKFVYDTTRIGHWNTGHPFGDHLTDAERRAVIEYLKTI